MASGSSPPLREPLLTASEVSALLGGIPPKTVLQYARDGRLPSMRIGKDVRFLRSDVGEAIDALRSTHARFRPSSR